MGKSLIRIAVFGRSSQADNYAAYVERIPAVPIVTMNLGAAAASDALLLPGGGDIDPAFFGQRNICAWDIDRELDILQFQALELCLHNHRPILGICKGMQLINVAFGGTVEQHLCNAQAHSRSNHRDSYHDTVIEKNSCLYPLYGAKAYTNSAHHQSVGRLGKGLRIIQCCPNDACPEAIQHETLPILGLQWHPERLDPRQTTLSGDPILSLLTFWINRASHS